MGSDAGGPMKYPGGIKDVFIRRESAFRHPTAWDKLCPGAIFTLLTGLYIVTMPEHATLEDSGALITVAQFSGIAHPPGYPLYTLLPFGTIAFRVQLLSAIAPETKSSQGRKTRC